MSASLVGSEMCIRDSLQRQPVVAQGSGALHLRLLARCRRTAAQKRETVSYTHLTLPTICSV
eukprot:13991627-Alexandrium_andersonii.AAC.1